MYIGRLSGRRENGRTTYGRWDNVIKVTLKVKRFFENMKNISAQIVQHPIDFYKRDVPGFREPFALFEFGK